MPQRRRNGYSEAALIVMTADTASSSTIRATKPDAFDCITEPFDFDQLLVGAPGA
jgi:DNA-binding NtrC family response regulator